jgi:MFS family permease
MLAQAFFYNAIFFTYSLTLTEFYSVAPERIGAFLLPFAAGNLLGPLLLGRLFDTIGRRPMIAFTYVTSGLLLAVTGAAFAQGALTATTHTFMWSLAFFFASAAASSGYLTVSEVFPLELRALAIALFYAIGTGTGGLIAPTLFGILIESNSRIELFYGYALAGGLMIGAGLLAYRLGVPAERRSLEEIAPPLSTAPGDAP